MGDWQRNISFIDFDGKQIMSGWGLDNIPIAYNDV